MFSPLKSLRTVAALVATGLVVSGVFLLGLGRSDRFMPHGHCYLWDPKLIWLHVVSDVLIGAAFLAIAFTLAGLVYHSRRQLPFHWMILAFGVFIVACGSTHLVEAWTVWYPHYWFAGSVKVITAIASVATAVLLPSLVSRVGALLQAARHAHSQRVELENEVTQRRAADEELRKFHAGLEQRVRERTSALSQANSALELYETLFKNAAWGIAIIDSVRNLIQLANPAFARMHGYAPEEMIGLAMLQTIAPGRREEYREIPARIVASGHYIYEIEHVRKDGTEFICLADVTVLRDPQGLPLYRFGYYQDITEQRRLEASGRQTEIALRNTFENAAVGISHVAIDGTWLRVNQRLCDIVGYPREELVRKSFQDITYPDDLAPDLANVRRLLAGEIQNYSMVKRYLRKDGSVVWVNLTVSLVRDPDGCADYFIAVVQQIEPPSPSPTAK